MGTCKLLIILGLLSNVVALSTCCSKKVVELPQQLIVEPMGETILNPVVEAYMDEVSYDADYSQTQILNYCSIQTEYRKDQPKPIEIQSDYHSGTLLVSSDSAFAHIVREINVLQKEDLFLYNLKPHEQYYWKLIQEDAEVDRGAFFISRDIRMCKINSLHNVRDLGGWKAGNGHVRYGIVYRGCEMDGLHGINITQDDIDRMRNDLGVKAVLDFRRNNEYASDRPVNEAGEIVSSLGEDVAYYYGNSYNISSYSSTSSYNEYANCFRAVLESVKNSRPIYCHCWGGNDRTGTFVFLLLGVLGVDESDLSKEYELSSFSYRTTENGSLPRRRDWGNQERGILFREFVEALNNRFPGNNINERIINYWFATGVKASEIEHLKKLMIEYEP